MSTATETIESKLGKVVSREEWLAARKALLDREKELTRANDEVTAQRRNLPVVKIDKDYTFKDESGSAVALSDLFQGNSQLIVYHFMFGPTDEKGCAGCSHIGEALPDVQHLRSKDTNIVCVSRGPTEKLQAFKREKGWAWPWFSSQGSDFNYDFHATVDESVCPVEVNFRSKQEMDAEKKRWQTGDVPGFSVFCKHGDDIFHTYSTWERGVEKFMPTLQLLDMTPLGRK